MRNKIWPAKACVGQFCYKVHLKIKRNVFLKSTWQIALQTCFILLLRHFVGLRDSHELYCLFVVFFHRKLLAAWNQHQRSCHDAGYDDQKGNKYQEDGRKMKMLVLFMLLLIGWTWSSYLCISQPIWHFLESRWKKLTYNTRVNSNMVGINHSRVM